MKEKHLKTDNRISFLNFIILRPYRSNLLTTDSKNWLVGMCFLAIFVAASEGIIWGYLLREYFFKQESFLFPILIGLIIALTIWFIDAQIINLDLSNYEKKDDEKKKRRFQIITSFLLKYIFSKPTLVLTSRIALVSISVFYTAPAAAKLVLSEEINEQFKINKINLESQLVTKIEQYYNQDIARCNKEYNRLSEDFEKEVGGTRGETGNIQGYGKIAKSIEKRKDDKLVELNNLRKNKDKELADLANGKTEFLQSKYNIYLDREQTASIREQAFEEVMKKKENQELATLSKLFIVLIFASLILLKIFQPKNISNYYNNRMQDAYLEYKRGELDHLISGYVKWNARQGMTTHSFFEFFDTIYVPYIKSRFILLKNENLNSLESRIGSLFDTKIKLDEKEAKSTITIKQMSQNQIDLENDLGNLNVKLSNLKNEINDLREYVNTTLSLKANSKLTENENLVADLTVEKKTKENLLDNIKFSISEMLKLQKATHDNVIKCELEIAELETQKIDILTKNVC
ncbi:hypothetical protein GQR60_18170 [Labilibaculum sp. A4]|uniref:hypothetical protein n=1 Tax=Labilibaculum euxinus TaxID=2686357 RepID=UPI000F62128E|nr:hypothetical protein [Labilibaculum euxinus]MDQ1772779.1 hypothetical protein [Labilibaculum euxinus]MWN78264.1 hypothetical protein [Labilibaculum euxinus]